MNNYYNCIYMYISPSKKIYIGKAKDLLKRKQRHINASYNKNMKRDYNVPFHRAIRKYGIESFDIIILKENLSQEEMDYWEYYYIELFDTYANHGKGYNIAQGGIGGNTFKGKTKEEMDEIKKKISESHKGKKLSEKHKQKIKESIDTSGEKNGMYGKHCSDEHKQKLRDAMKGKPNGRASKLIERLDADGNIIDIKYRFEYIDMGFDGSSITKCCQGKRKTVGLNGEKFIFKYHKE